MSLLEQDTTRKKQVDEEIRQIEFNAGDDESGEYKVEAIRDSAVYVRESKSGHLPDLYYLISWKWYPEEENTWKPTSAVQHLGKLINSFHKDYPDKPTATSPAIDTAPPIARPIVTPSESLKQKRGRPANSTNKQAKKNWAAFYFYHNFEQIRITYTFNILSRIARDCTLLHVTAYDKTRLLSNLHQNFLQNLNFFSLLSLSHKASVFFLELPLGQEVFYRRLFISISPSIIIDWSFVRFSSAVSLHQVRRFFHYWHDPLRLISFPMGLRYSHLSLGLPPQSPKELGGFLPSYTHTYTHTFDGAHV